MSESITGGENSWRQMIICRLNSFHASPIFIVLPVFLSPCRADPAPVVHYAPGENSERVYVALIDRMPVLLGLHDLDAWLTGKAGTELLQPAPNDFLCMWPVSRRVNVFGCGDDDPSLIEAVEDKAIAAG
jgi:hypothetical protein